MESMTNNQPPKHPPDSEREKIALDLLEKGVAIATISAKTGLSAEEVEALRVIKRAKS